MGHPESKPGTPTAEDTEEVNNNEGGLSILIDRDDPLAEGVTVSSQDAGVSQR
ncbi:Uu.00g146670.m01.CDS01 [Anthostomella pinea]|uniref:Uu.00g146670.m01.CDS01 n=1 Tax=Anthostomella pinea TaxID=933095 RepID=A0AAI8VR86_9PEZI|nr:Uu.00g146670.m01.CDS01 [Anthostomella pinea]